MKEWDDVTITGYVDETEHKNCIQVPDDGQKRVALTREELELVCDKSGIMGYYEGRAEDKKYREAVDAYNAAINHLFPKDAKA